MIAKVDKYLAGWAARLLPPVGRLVLINAVLDSIPTYAMVAMLLPPPVVKPLDTLRRTFLWNIVAHVSGAQCLVAWEKVCRSKMEGGHMVHDLVSENKCLLLKMLHCLHSTVQLRWVAWVCSELDVRSLLTRGAHGLEHVHCRSICSMLPLYRALPSVSDGDGRRCSIWHDC